MISESAFQHCVKDHPWPTLQLKTAKVRGALVGRQADIQFQSHMTIICKGHEWDLDLTVVPMLAIDLLLRMDFLIDHKAILDVGRGELVLNKEGKTTRFREQKSQSNA